MTHVCAGHACDNCLICRAGVCCAGLSADQRVQLEAALHRSEPWLRAAIEQEADAAPSVAELVRLEAGRRFARLPRSGSLAALLPASVPAPRTTTEPRKEPVYEPAARPIR